MSKYMCTHSVKGLTRDRYAKLAEESQKNSKLRCIHSYANLTEGKIFCVWESPKEELLADWFKKMDVPCDCITKLELEQEGSTVLAA